MRRLAIIPARYASTRFPGKPLILIQSKPMIQHVYERVSASGLFEEVVVATDDSRIEKKVLSFSGKVIMTSSLHKSGTDRCGEVVNLLSAKGENYDIVVNIQGDEPFINKEQLASVIDCFSDQRVEIATLKKRISNQEELFSPNIVKIVTDKYNKALYFSRCSIPFYREENKNSWILKGEYFKHIGLYAYRTSILQKLIKLPQTNLERIESLEQLRWLENGYKITVAETIFENIAIDTPEDLHKLNM